MLLIRKRVLAGLLLCSTLFSVAAGPCSNTGDPLPQDTSETFTYQNSPIGYTRYGPDDTLEMYLSNYTGH